MVAASEEAEAEEHLLREAAELVEEGGQTGGEEDKPCEVEKSKKFSMYANRC